MLWVLLGVFVSVLLITTYAGGESGESIAYSTFLDQAEKGRVESIQYTNGDAHITGEFKDGTNFTTTGLTPFPDADLALLRKEGVEIKPKPRRRTSSSSGSRSCSRWR